VGWGIKGSGGAYIRDTLRYPPENLSVLGLIDKLGVFGVESFEGGTDTIRVDEYISRKIEVMHARGVDVLILDNCPSHRIATIAYWCAFYGIAVDFLPRYWPQWNPIEVCVWCAIM
jgi:transposase